jgi:hypothetical protein
MKRAVDIAVGAMMFALAIYHVWWNYEYLRSIAFLERFPWYYWGPPLCGGCLGVIAAIGLYFEKRFWGVVGSFSMLIISLSYILLILDNVILQEVVRASLCFLTSLLVYWRFARRPHENGYRPVNRTAKR